STSAVLQLLIEEKLREEEHAAIVFRDTAIGRQPYVEGTRLAVWQIMLVAREYAGDAARTAGYLEIPVTLVQAAQAYADHFPDEIKAALDEYDAIDFETLRRILPNLGCIEVPAPGSVPA
ncbi:MAG: hypothetical protein M3Z66_21780, partial [Chloroflexota bacterium]|nr:hypothetical protein [Chloroflexota bacterium]